MTPDLAALAELVSVFDAKAFALEVRLAMARENLSLRKLQAVTGVDQASIHRAAFKELSPSIETYLRLRLWMDARAAMEESTDDR